MPSEPVQPLPPSHGEKLRKQNEGREHPDYPNPNDPMREQQRAAQTATARRLEREEATLDRGQVAGYDFKREAREQIHGHERERDR